VVTRPTSKCPCKVLAHYPAPIQVTWIGHPTTTGDDRSEQRFLISTLLFLMSTHFMQYLLLAGVRCDSRLERTGSTHVSSGLDCMHYRFVDSVTDPSDTMQWHSEELW
jgi:predicted O-linked N-acetylglucosamine transferase (SPINDLY family)